MNFKSTGVGRIIEGRSVRLLVAAPPRSGKTTFFATNLIPAYKRQNPTKTVGYFTWSHLVSREYANLHRLDCYPAGVDVALTGRGFDLVIIDQPYHSWYADNDSVVQAGINLVSRGDSVIVVHERYRQNDLIGRLRNEPNFEYHAFKAENDDQRRSEDVERWNALYLQEPTR